MLLEEIQAGSWVAGIKPDQVVSVIAVQWHGLDAIELTYKTAAGALGQQNLFRTDEPGLSMSVAGRRPFDAAASDFKLVAEAQRISLAGLFDPMLAVATSDVQPLPHQIRAVYGELLPRTPLRFLLADDPGAGKTIMAGLYIKELLLRDDVKRCLIVAPGGLVEQWQDELFFKFGLRFDLLTNQLINAQVNLNVFDVAPLLIARMDQLSRNEQLQRQLAATEWDLIVVDEAHRMGAHYYGANLQKTKRFQLGELLGRITRHLLLMTATPHSGKEEDFQLFLSLLDPDRFEGKQKHSADISGIMRRMVKEDLLTFDGKRLFPERIAETVPYELTALERELYEDVTRYVRDGMNRADRIGGKRRNTVGFALTVLQRRLASSPEAIYQSLVRRAKRLERYRQEILNGSYQHTDYQFGDQDQHNGPDIDPKRFARGSSGSFHEVDYEKLDGDEYNADELEQLEEELLDSATAAQTVAELEAELVDLDELIGCAQRVRAAGSDRKWTELSNILQDGILQDEILQDVNLQDVNWQDKASRTGCRRKFIIFTEHRDTLNYLTRKISSLLGRDDAVRAIHGGVRRSDRRQITEEFTKNADCQILLATDAAGEGLNLQAAHLMVNYDLPWNPNRIEQRFGRIHRIGQTEVCRLWNLVAANTREGEVFARLLEKLDQMRETYGGKVFDVLGEAFTETPLRDLLLAAIRYGELPEVKAKMHEVIDASVATGVKDLLAERALAAQGLAEGEVRALRAAMDDARARRLQPHYIELAFKAAFTRFGGRLAMRERGRYEIANVPQRFRVEASGPVATNPVATKYSRVTFDLAQVQPDELTRADLLAPGHPLHDTVMAAVINEFGEALSRGTILISPTLTEPQLLVGVTEEIADATGGSVARRFGYAYVSSQGLVTPAGPAPYLDCVAAPDGSAVAAARRFGWLADAEETAKSWIISNQIPQYLAEVQPRRLAELSKVRTLVTTRLEGERDRLLLDATVAAEDEQQGKTPKQSSSSLSRKAAELDHRLNNRLQLLAQQQLISTKPPNIMTAALVLPLSMVSSELPGDGGLVRVEPDHEDGHVQPGQIHAKETKMVERRGIDLVMECERRLGRDPVEQAFNNPGFDILSIDLAGDTYRIEVKARIEGADDFWVTHNEVMTGKNAVPRYRLALVKVDPRGPQHDEVRYLDDPFARVDFGDFDTTGHKGDWAKSWAKGSAPF